MKKGFTLIELLAVIVIIGLISVLIIPKVQNTLKESKQKTYEASAHALQREADNFYIMKKTEKTSFDGCTYDFTNNTNTCNGFEFTGEKPERGVLKVAENGFTSYALKFDNYCYIKYGQSGPIVNSYNQETCKIEEPSSFETDSWETISVAVKTNNTSAYSVGDTKEITLDGFGTHTVRIANTSTPEECKEPGFSQTACGFVVEFVDIINKHRMNPYVENSEELGNGNIGDWEYSEMRSYLNNEIYNSFPEELKNSIIPTYVVSGMHVDSPNIFTTNDKLYLLALSEIYENQSYEKTNYSKLLDHYTATFAHGGEYLTARKKNYNGTTTTWWLRNAHILSSYPQMYITMDTYGTPMPVNSTSEYGVSPAFRL